MTPTRRPPRVAAGSLLLSLLILAACSTTKHLPEGAVLYTGIREIEVRNEDKTPPGETALEEIEAALAYPPNNALLGSSSIRVPFPFGLWVYNAFVNKKGKVGKWIFNQLAAKPVLITTVNPEVRVKVARNLLNEYGYFKGETAFEVIPDPKNPRKAKLAYRVTMNDAYTLDSIRYVPIRHCVDSLIDAASGDRILREGAHFNVVRLQAERERISSLLRDNGYYYFRPDFITYQADTLLSPGKVALRVAPKESLPPSALRPWKLGEISVWLNGYRNEPPTDSIRYKDLTIHYEGKLRVRPSVIYNRLYFKPGELYSQRAQERTQTALSRLGIFRYAELHYSPRDTLPRQDTLDVRINTVYDLPLDGELELNVTAKSNDQVGPGAIFSVTKRNLFGGGETFGVKLRGSYEWQTGNKLDGSSSKINSYELGLTTTLTFPRVLFPTFSQRDLNFPASTTFRLYADQMNRARFFQLLAFGGDASYEFQPTATSRHSITPFKLTFNLLQHTTHEFDSITDVNKALKKSLQDQFIPAMSYTYTYDDSPITTRRNHLWWQASVTQAGLILDGIYALAGKKFSQEDKKLLGNPFAQFIKGTAEIRYDYALGHKQHLVGRLMAGAIYSYGNARTAPYNEQFYIGGANSIRAFTIRSIGPGRYYPDSDDHKYAYIDRTGDLAFEANLEYRFPILGDLYGATFLDSGNIWLIRDDPERPGGQLRRGSFLKDLALGTGFGLRYDLTFIVIRFDVGIGLHLPYDTGKKGYYNLPKFKDGMGYHLAIGYPF
ncbi:BamA/TamA family outer membrane protein [Parabacteroides sp. ZJ-118]|uniref:translocation and assembly module lipoprotein TamL n=1 Tax=Parabacteroides sp. ZJ-118 TaxID=2709398 RepID=UPI0013EB3385|nr:BamA/TamA family outer membrane protein [Parabacteroides sp. ZJ-118]